MSRQEEGGSEKRMSEAAGERGEAAPPGSEHHAHGIVMGIERRRQEVLQQYRKGPAGESRAPEPGANGTQSRRQEVREEARVHRTRRPSSSSGAMSL